MTNCEGLPARVVPVPRVQGGEARALVAHDALATVLADAGQPLRDVVGKAPRDRGEPPPRAHISAHRHSKRRVFTVKSPRRPLPHNLPGAWGDNRY
jgi:hypothetical protein